MAQSLDAIKMEGIISVIGILSGSGGQVPDIMQVLTRICTVRGVYVGSKEQMEEMVKAVEEHDIHPVLDKKVFTLETTKDAYEYMVSPRISEVGLQSLLTNVAVGSEALWQGWHQD